jgi:hypothetical protein
MHTKVTVTGIVSRLPTDRYADLRRRFSEHGVSIYGSSSSRNASPLYAYLAQCVAQDPDVLALVIDADRATTVTNLFFGAVHYLLLGDRAHPLAGFYADLSPQPQPPTNAYPAFRTFCLDHGQEIRHLVQTQRVQTNEVGRCAGLLPAFHLLGQQNRGRPLALVEIGASAGLHLLWDRYHYDYGPAGTIGDRRSPVRIMCEPRGPSLPPLPSVLPEVILRVGIDIAPVDVTNQRATRWLQALIWPEHTDRHALLVAALTLARQQPPRVVSGDAAEILPTVLAGVPANAVLCVYDSYTLNQVPRSVRNRVLAHLVEHAAVRDLYRVAQEGFSLTEPPHVEITTYRKDEVRHDLLAHTESHGRWLEWLGMR